MRYVMDISADGSEWNQAFESDNIEVLKRAGRSYYSKGYFVDIYDDADRLVWRDGRIAGELYQLSRFEQEWFAVFGSVVPRYESTVPFETQGEL